MANEDKIGIYAIENLVTGRDYIGMTTTSFAQRWSEHKFSLQRGEHVNLALQDDWDLYGEASFEFYIVEIVQDVRMVADREAHWIELNSTYCTLDETYNISGMTMLRREKLISAYREAGASGQTFASVYAQYRGTKEIVFPAWQEGRRKRSA